MSLTIGMHTGQQNISIDELRKLWKFADSNGFDFISVWDHFYEAPSIDGNTPVFEAISLMSALAVETKNANIGCHVFCATYRNVGLLAKSIMTIDHLSNGRVELGIGAGGHEPEHLAFGFPFSSAKDRADRLEETIQSLRLLLTQTNSTFSGRFVSLSNAIILPQPIQSRIPIIVGGRGEQRTLRTAARHADGWNVPYVEKDEFERLTKILDHWCEIEQRDPKILHKSVNLHMRMGITTKDVERINNERGQIQGSLTGTKQQAIDTINQYSELGAARISIAIRPPIEWDALHLFAEEVIPQVKK